MSKPKRVNLASIRKQMAALREAQAQEELRIKESLAAGFTSEAVEKLASYSEADTKRIGAILSGYVDDCIQQLEADKKQKKAKYESAKENVIEAAEEVMEENDDDIPEDADDGYEEEPQVRSNYGYQQTGYQNNGNY